jgi:hypothetical protein
LVLVWTEACPLDAVEREEHQAPAVVGLLVVEEDVTTAKVIVNVVKIFLHPVCSQIRRETYR